MDDPYGFLNLKVEKILQYEGDIYNCIHVFISRTFYLDTINNCFFENKICIEKSHPQYIK